jgi:hypothetical protein
MNPASEGRPDGWHEIFLQNAAVVRFSFSNGAGGLRGVVKTTGQPVVGAPVYLEAYDPIKRVRLTDLRSTRTDIRGAYQFENLAPGSYRLLSTFEYQSPSTGVMDIAGARSFQMEAREQAQMDPELYVLP